jgi:glucose-1-phosphatase
VGPQAEFIFSDAVALPRQLPGSGSVFTGNMLLTQTLSIPSMQYNSDNIRNIILDFGGVIYQIDHQRQIQAFKNLGVENFESLYSQAMQSPLFAQFERGEITPDQLRSAIKKILGNSKITSTQIDAAWNSILIGFHEPTIRLLERLRSRYRLFLLSNTNSIHYDIYQKDFSERFGFDFDALFEKTYWSFKMGMRKPDAEIFQFVISDTGVNPSETIFIDDTHQNIEGSVQAGLPAMHLSYGVPLSRLLDDEMKLRSG